MKQEIFWALHREGIGFISGTALTRKELIRDAEKSYQRSWKDMRKLGFRAVKVKLTPANSGN